MNYYQRIKDLRNDKDETQADIAKILETSISKISDYENGNTMMKIDKYIKLAKHYNVSLDYLTGLIDIPRPLEDNARIKVNTINPKEKALLKAYRSNKQIQWVINKILDIEE